MSENENERDQTGRFKPGVSGNPNGRPPGRVMISAETADKVSAVLDTNAEAVMKKIVDLAIGNGPDSLRACGILAGKIAPEIRAVELSETVRTRDVNFHFSWSKNDNDNKD